MMRVRRWWSITLLLCIFTVILLFSLLQLTVPLLDTRPGHDASEEFTYLGTGIQFFGEA
jgi:hypothetical protein